jgi:hypothetical protein
MNALYYGDLHYVSFFALVHLRTSPEKGFCMFTGINITKVYNVENVT